MSKIIPFFIVYINLEHFLIIDGWKLKLQFVIMLVLRIEINKQVIK